MGSHIPVLGGFGFNPHAPRHSIGGAGTSVTTTQVIKQADIDEKAGLSFVFRQHHLILPRYPKQSNKKSRDASQNVKLKNVKDWKSKNVKSVSGKKSANGRRRNNAQR